MIFFGTLHWVPFTPDPDRPDTTNGKATVKIYAWPVAQTFSAKTLQMPSDFVWPLIEGKMCYTKSTKLPDGSTEDRHIDIGWIGPVGFANGDSSYTGRLYQQPLDIVMRESGDPYMPRYFSATVWIDKLENKK